jgi:hypothetical protein
MTRQVKMGGKPILVAVDDEMDTQKKEVFDGRLVLLRSGERTDCARYLLDMMLDTAECREVFRAAVDAPEQVERAALTVTVKKHWEEVCSRYDEVAVVGSEWPALVERVRKQIAATIEYVAQIQDLDVAGKLGTV